MSVALNFDKSNFTSVFFKIWECNTRIMINYGGTRSSKSVSQAQKELLKMMSERMNILVLRKTGESLKYSCKPLITERLIREWEERSGFPLSRDFVFNKAESILYNKRNGSRLYFSGLDNPEKIKSIEGIRRIWMEEANEFELADFLEINRRASGFPDIQISLTFNPIVETLWINEVFFKQDFPGCTKIHSTYRDNMVNLTREDMNNIEHLQKIDPEQYRVYGLGEWGSVRTGHEYYYAFSYGKHVGDVEFNPALPVFISMDQNVVPYITMLCFQVQQYGDVYNIYQFDELCLKNPHNTTEELCKAFAGKYGGRLNGLYYYGDASGKKRDTRGIENDYDIVDRVLSRWLNPNSRRIPSANPHLSKRRDFMNRVLGGYYPINYFVDRKCTFSITDLEMVKEDVDRGKMKDKVRDKATGISYEPYGHCSDALDYFICENFKSYYYA